MQTVHMPIRLRFPELLEERGLTAYALSVATGGKISMSTVYRWTRARGRIQTIMAKTVVLKYTPKLTFIVDPSIDRGNRVLSIIEELEKTLPED